MTIRRENGSYDLAVVGAGIVGLAHAYMAARRGMRVVVFESGEQAQSASIRNFGLIWPIGQPADRYALAKRSRDLWMEVLKDSGLYHAATGSLHLAYRDDEAAVAQEFARKGPELGCECEWLDAGAVAEKSGAVRREGLRGALWSATEVTVDPRQVVRELPRYLAKRFDVEFVYGTEIRAIEQTELAANEGRWRAERTVVCPGSRLSGLYAKELQGMNLRVCKLQMMRTAPQASGWHLGAALAGGLTLRFYQAFQICETLGALRERIARETPEFERFGIHTMVSQGADGSLTLGDSHEYGSEPSPFLSDEIDRLMLAHIAGYLDAPEMKVAERWYGVYAKNDAAAYATVRVDERVTVVTGFGGAGMTLSFGAAEKADS